MLSQRGLLTALLLAVSASATANDGDQDGVSDAIDRCPKTPANAAINNSGCHFQHTGELFTVQFKPGSAWINAEQTLALRNVAKQLKRIVNAFPGTQIAVRGFHGGGTDQSPAEDLSSLRAKNVFRQLKLSQLPATAMIVKGMGRAAVANNEAAARRVDILVLDWPPRVPQAP